jgi:phytoene/squalene synthetase
VQRLVQGFQKDATAKRFRNWSELIGYCRFAAAPIGQFLVELHGEDRTSARAAESLFTAKHILRRIQRSKADYIGLDRVYLPGDWMRRAGVEPAALGESRVSPNLRRVFDQTLDGVDDMIVIAGSGLTALSDRQFRIAMQTELAAVRRFAAALRRSDPLRRPISLSRPAQLLCVLSGHVRGFWPAAGRA